MRPNDWRFVVLTFALVAFHGHALHLPVVPLSHDSSTKSPARLEGLNVFAELKKVTELKRKLDGHEKAWRGDSVPTVRSTTLAPSRRRLGLSYIEVDDGTSCESKSTPSVTYAEPSSEHCAALAVQLGYEFSDRHVPSDQLSGCVALEDILNLQPPKVYYMAVSGFVPHFEKERNNVAGILGTWKPTGCTVLWVAGSRTRRRTAHGPPQRPRPFTGVACSDRGGISSTSG